jgi:hypothetical protein
MKSTTLQDIYRKISETPHAGSEAQEAAESFIDQMKGKRVLIYPAGALGRLLSKTLRSYGIITEYFIDRAAGEIGLVSGIPVKDPSFLSSADRNSVVLVAANTMPLYNTLKGVVEENNQDIPVMDGFFINRILRYPVCRNQLEDQQSFDIVQCENCGYEGKGCVLCHTYLQRVSPGIRHDDIWRSKSFDWFGYIVGQRCTMKCRHCCESIPYLPNPGFTPCDTIISDINKIAQSCDFLKFVEFVGGEPFLHPEFQEILTKALQIENIGYIKSFTNGTIVPPDSLCEILKNPRFMLQVSNYEKTLTGTLRDRFFATKKKLDDWNIHYVYAPQTEWRDFSSFKAHNDSKHSLETIFQCCPLAGCHRLYKGVLFRCPHQYAGIQLKKLAQVPVECIDLNKFGQKDLAKAIEAFEKVPYIDACRYCALPFDAKIVPAGEQL